MKVTIMATMANGTANRRFTCEIEETGVSIKREGDTPGDAARKVLEALEHVACLAERHLIALGVPLQ